MRSTGTYRYSPALRDGSLLRRDGGTTQWWLIIDCDPELGRFLRHMYHLGSHRTRRLQEPLWGTHISVIRDEVPPHLQVWKSLEGQRVEFEFAIEACETEGFVWLPVNCELALDHRVALGLPRQPSPPLHITIGNRIE